jgi:predicted phage terminase large subunit-like protein
LAATEAGGDYLSGTLEAYNREDDIIYLEDQVLEQLGPADVEHKVFQTAQLDGKSVRIGIEQEPGASGKSLVEHYKNNVLRDFTVQAVSSSNSGNKLVRAQPYLAGAEAGKVYIVIDDTGFPADTPLHEIPRPEWVEIVLRQFDAFDGSGSGHDDTVDTAAAAYTILTGRKAYSATWGRKKSTMADVKNSKALRRDMSRAAILSSTNSLRRATWGRR